MKVFLSMFCLFFAVEGYTFANKTKLHKDLFTNYEKKFRPGENQVIPTELNFSFYMKSLNEFQGSNEKMGVVGSLGVEWKDVRLAWNPSYYGGDLNQTSVFVDDIWTPYLVLMNPYEEITPILSGGFSCKVWYNGNVSCLPPPNIFEALCNALTSMYPYDTKNCTSQLYVPGYYSEDLKLKTRSLAFNTDMYIYHGMWNVTGTRIFVQSQYVDNIRIEILQLEISMQRIPGDYLLHISPIFVLSVMKIFVFRLPDESGERVGFSLTILLAEIVFITVIQENVPKAPISVLPVLVFKQFFDILIGFFILIGVIHASILYDRERTKEPKKTEETPVEVELAGIYYDEQKTKETKKTEELKKTVEPKKSEETPSNLIVKTKDKILSGKRVDRLYAAISFFLIAFINIVCFLIVSRG